MRRLLVAMTVLSMFLVVSCQKKQVDAQKPETKKEQKVEEKVAPPAEATPAPEATPEAAVEEKAVEEKPAEAAVEEKAVEEKPAEAAVEEKAVEEKPAEAVVEEKPAVPDYNDLKQRSERVQEIYKLREAKTPEELAVLKGIITGEFLPFEKATAMRVLPMDVAKEMVEDLKTLAQSDNRSVVSEAAILLYRSGEKDFARPILEDLVTKGLAVRRAFFITVKDGKYEYEPEAESFFVKEMEAEQIHVRLDGALGMLHLEKKKEALAAFRAALDYGQPQNVRLTAVSYLASVRTMPEAQGLLEYASKDPDTKVSNRASQILNPQGMIPNPAPAPEAAAEKAPEKAPEAAAKE